MARSLAPILTALLANVILVPSLAARPGGGGGGAAEDLDSILAAMEWYDTSIQSYRIRYRTVITPDPGGRRYQMKQLRPNADQAQFEEWANKTEDQEWEIVRSGTWIRVKASFSESEMVWAYKGEDVRSVVLDRHGSPTSGGIGGEIADEQVPPDAPLLAAGVRILERAPPYHVAMREPTTKLTGPVQLEGEQVHKITVKKGPAELHYYVDPKHQFLPRRIELTHPRLAKTDAIERFGRFVDQRSQEERWFPVVIVTKSFFDHRLTSAMRTETISFEINPTIPDGVFDLVLPDGILVTDNRTHETRMTGSPERRGEIAEKLAAQAKSALDTELVRAAANQRRLDVPSRSHWLSIGVGIFSLGLVVIGLLLKRRTTG